MGSFAISRDLENVLERAVINSSGPNCASSMTSVNRSKMQRKHILRVLELINWNVSGKGSESEILGLNRSTLRARIAKLKIENP